MRCASPLQVPGLLQIQITLQIAKHLIVDASLAAKAQEGPPLHPEQFVRERPVLTVVQGPRAVAPSGARGQGIELFAIVLREVVVHAAIFGAIMAARFFEMVESRLEGDPMRLLLFAVGARSARETQARINGARLRPCTTSV